MLVWYLWEVEGWGKREGGSFDCLPKDTILGPFFIYRDCFLIVLVSKYSPTVGYKRASLQPCAVSNPCIIGQHISYLWAPSFLSQLQPHMACCCLFYILETSMSGLVWSFFPIWMKFPLDAYLVRFPPWSTCTYLTLQWCFNNHSAMTGTVASHSISPLPRMSSPNPFLLWFIFCLLSGTYAFFTTHDIDFSSLWFIDDLWG